MRKLLTFLIALGAVALVTLSAPTKAVAGCMSLLGLGSTSCGAAPPAGYVGPVDINGTAVGYWGARAASAADRGNALLNVCNSTGGVDVGCADLSSSATTGALVPATVSGITCPGANCTVKIIYDRSGAGHNLSNATVATRPTLPAAVTGGNACMQVNGSQFLSSGSSITLNASGSTTTSVVAEDTATPSNFGAIYNADNSGHGIAVNPGNVNQWAVSGMYLARLRPEGPFIMALALSQLR